MRRAVHHLEGPTRSFGDPDIARLLHNALDTVSDPHADALYGLHGVHSYPARMHPAIAASVLDQMQGVDVVIDPFCGSGTALVCAQERGCLALGSDLNPLAVRLSRMKLTPWSDDQLAGLQRVIDDVGERTSDSIRTRAEHRLSLPDHVHARFDGHVLRALGSLLAAIHVVRDDRQRHACLLLVSAIIPKLRLRQGDTDRGEGATSKRIGRFLPAQLFVQKGGELVERLRDHRASLPPQSPVGVVLEQDARDLPSLTRKHLDGTERALVLSSPPYGGTYDYLQHHEDRLALLQLSDRGLRDHEFGARRSQQRDGAQGWDTEVRQMLTAMADALPARGRVVLLMGDGLVNERIVPADEQLKRLAPGCGLAVVGGASAPRPDWYARQQGQEQAIRYEHLIGLAKR
jgi:hypothetical protein